MRLCCLAKRVLRCRAEVHERIIEVERNLPNRFGLVVLDGWRDLTEQQMLREFYESQGLQRLCSQYGVNCDAPPHTTGGALDVTLSYNGLPLALEPISIHSRKRLTTPPSRTEIRSFAVCDDFCQVRCSLLDLCHILSNGGIGHTEMMCGSTEWWRVVVWDCEIGRSSPDGD